MYNSPRRVEEDTWIFSIVEWVYLRCLTCACRKQSCPSHASDL